MYWHDEEEGKDRKRGVHYHMNQLLDAQWKLEVLERGECYQSFVFHQSIIIIILGI